ncbi:MAG: NAD(P)H-dependent oxidoreductase [Crocinitomicaceae bacterium]|nr:NAD(P)H-dependent oxidoreductase [Crocinitomicaceae bacterium]|tara:strand:- start:14486 stop:15118 length:633 start_codon:yes stop_codon:yes gene_type:complete
MHDIIRDLNWRYATKKYDSSKKIKKNDLEIIKESLRLVPSSYGLQPLKFIIVNSTELREKLKPISYNQSQITDASHLIIICSYININTSHVDDYLSSILRTRDIAINEIEAFGNSMKTTIDKMKNEEKYKWNKNQAYIALGQLIHTCASLRIDATPMEGFNAKEYDKLLNLSDQNLSASLVVPIGYRHKEDKVQFAKKVRKSQDDLFITL